MTGATDAALPRLRADVEALIVGDRFLLVVGNETHELSGPDAHDLAVLVESLGSGALAEQCAKDLDCSGARVKKLLSELDSKGCFRSSVPSSDRESVPKLTGATGFVGFEPTAWRIARKVALDGGGVSFVDGRAGRGRWGPAGVPVPSASASLRARTLSGVAARDGVRVPPLVETHPWTPRFRSWVGDQDRLVVATGGFSPATHEAVNAVAGDLGIPWIGIREGEEFTEIGPVVAPPFTPCYACYALRVILNREPGGDGPSPVESAPSGWWGDEGREELVAALATAALRSISGPEPRGMTTSAWRIDWRRSQVVRDTVLPLPNCPACETWSRGGRTP